jgi:hypothetical protein
MNQPYLSYSVDITELSTGITRRVPMACPWSDTASPFTWSERMCDCNIAGYFNKGYLILQEGKPEELVWRLYDSHTYSSGIWREHNSCDHTMPPTRFSVSDAHISDGRLVALQS